MGTPYHVFFVRFLRACDRFHLNSRFSNSSFDALTFCGQRYQTFPLPYCRARVVLAVVSFSTVPNSIFSRCSWPLLVLSPSGDSCDTFSSGQWLLGECRRYG